jgi:hypothetical protein
MELVGVLQSIARDESHTAVLVNIQLFCDVAKCPVVGWAHGRSGRVQKISSSPRLDLQTVQPLASRYTDWAIPAQKNAVLFLRNDPIFIPH